MSTESIPTTASSAFARESCARCGAPVASDQRYCLECGERRTPMSSVLLGGPASGAPARPPSTPRAPGAGLPGGAGERSATLTVIAGVGVLLLAMGVGVLIGRSTGAGTTAASPSVISVASAPTSAPASAGPSESSFTGDWPAGTRGYTVELQALPQAGTSTAAVQAAKAAASSKGARNVGALRSEEFSSLAAGSYVIYSGVFHTAAQAQHALPSLRKSFPGAKVIRVSNKSSSRSSSPAAGAGAGGSGAGTLSHPAPPSAVKGLQNVKGKSYEEKSKNLPNVISTG